MFSAESHIVRHLIRRLPAPSTLFPYTTLFRSGQRRSSARADGWSAGSITSRRRGRADASRPTGPCSTSRPAWITATWSQDRKSTRLNSSHANISYAVFFLKKKKKSLYTIHKQE